MTYLQTALLELNIAIQQMDEWFGPKGEYRPRFYYRANKAIKALDKLAGRQPAWQRPTGPRKKGKCGI